MTTPNALRLASVAIAAAAVLGGPYAAAALTPSGELAAHRAVYELKLAKTSGKGGAVAARGRQHGQVLRVDRRAGRGQRHRRGA